MPKEISMSEVKRHNSSKTCWIVIHNNVYDVTGFLAEHPGGETALLELAGKNATTAFEDVGHSDDAKNMMKKYQVGKISEGVKTPSSSSSCCRSPNKTAHKSASAKKPSSRCGSCANSCQPLRISPSSTCCDRIKEDKPWRTFDQEDEERTQILHIPCQAKAKQAARARSKKHHHQKRAKKEILGSTACPREEAGGGFNLKWALVALAAAVVAGVIIRRSLG